MVIDTTNPPMRLTAQGVACCAPTDPIGGTLCRGAGVARYAPTGDWERRAIPYMPHLHGDVVFRVVALQGTGVRNSLPSR